MRLEPLTLNKFKPNSNINYLLSEFSKKAYSLATKAIEFGAGVSKIPGSNVFIYEGDTALDSKNTPKESSTIIIKGGNLVLSGSITTSHLYIVPDGNITFAGGCKQNQEIYGAAITNGKLLSDRPYNNTNLLNQRCYGGGLVIYGTIAGNGMEELIATRRSKLQGRFLKTNYRDKYQSIIHGASVLIKPNTNFNNYPPPGRSELRKSIEITK